MNSKTLPTFLAGLIGLTAAFPASAATLFFDFGGSTTTTPGAHNNLFYTTQLSVPNAVDSAGVPTGISAVAAGFNNVNTDGPGNGTHASATGSAAIFPDTATRDSFYGNTANFNGIFPSATVTLTGLDGNQIYTFDFLGARMGVGSPATDIRETQYAVAGLNAGEAFLNATNNSTNIATVPGIVPSGGIITITVDPGPGNTNGNGFYYLNAMRITSAPVPEPSAAGLMILTGAALLRRRRTAV
jgi:hypothetical protein